MKRKIYISTLLIAILLLTGCSGGDGNGNGLTDSFRVTVYVYDSETNELINQEVLLSLNGVGQTTSNGSSVFLNVSPGKTKLEVSSEGYIKHSEEITVSSNDEHKVYLTRDDQSLETLVTNIRNTGMSLTNIWEPQITRLERHITEKFTPFTEELSDLLVMLMEPLNDPYFEFDVTYANKKIYFTHEYVKWSYYDGVPEFRVVYEIDVHDYWYWIDTGNQSLLNMSFSMYKGYTLVGSGNSSVNAYITDPYLYSQWAEWLEYPVPGYEPTAIFFSAADMTANAWFQTPSFGRIQTDSKLHFDVDTMTLSVDGSFDSEVMYSRGEFELVFAEEINDLYDWEYAIYPKELKFYGCYGFAGIAELEGDISMSFVPNEYHGTIMPDKASINGKYKDLNSMYEEVIADGSFNYSWETAATFKEDYNLGLTASFKGFVQEPARPKIELEVYATFDTLLRGDVRIDYAYGSHYLKGTASISNQLDSRGQLVSSSMGIQLRNEHDLRISLVLNENLKEQKPKIGEIKDPNGELLAEICLLDGIPYIFYPYGHYESLL
ncbi:MAG: carboxypeptidase-like regulatory domain-containing protein [Bacteroidales bacterium]|nr:carboxypeptidase-like regulatory domain-containing protein [Bacteroidales bacterium]